MGVGAVEGAEGGKVPVVGSCRRGRRAVGAGRVRRGGRGGRGSDGGARGEIGAGDSRAVR